MLLMSAVHKYCSAGTHLLGSGLAVVTLLVTLFVGRWFVKLPGASLGVGEQGRGSGAGGPSNSFEFCAVRHRLSSSSSADERTWLQHEVGQA